MGEMYSVHYLVALQMDENTEVWNVIETDKISYDNIIDSLNNEDNDELQMNIDSMTQLEMIAEEEYKEDMISIITAYADANPVTIYVTIPTTH